MILPSLMLQKPSLRSKAKDHADCLGRWLELWRKGDIEFILKEIRHIQSKSVSSKRPRSQEDRSRIFAKLVMEGKLNVALKFLDEDSGKGVLKLSESVIKELKEKHPDPAGISEEALLNGPIDYIPKCLFDAIDEQTVLKAALLTKGSAGPSGMDAEIYRRMLCSKNFSSVSKTLREEIATFTWDLLTLSYHPSLLEAYIASRLIPLHKNPGIRPIGVGEVLSKWSAGV